MNFEDLGKKFKKFSQDTVTEVQKMNEVRQMNSRIGDQKKQISVLYSQIGQKLYNHYKENPLEGFEKEFHELEERYAMIEKFKDQIRDIKGVRVCPNCHTEVEATERFCSSCGEKLPEILHISEDEEGKVVIEGTAEEVEAPEAAAEETEEAAEETEEVAEAEESEKSAREAAEKAVEESSEADGATWDLAEEVAEEAEKAEVEK